MGRTKEVWVDVVGYKKHYEVSNMGRVRRKETMRILKPRPLFGYTRVSLSVNGVVRDMQIHRIVLMSFYPSKKKFETDHKDRNRSNNKLSNLRKCTRQQNVVYQNKISRKVTSKYKGICWNKKDKAWVASTTINNKYFYIGGYKDEHDAATAYNKKLKQIHGEFAFQNKIKRIKK